MIKYRYKFRKLTAALAVIMLAGSLAGCGSSEEPERVVLHGEPIEPVTALESESEQTKTGLSEEELAGITDPALRLNMINDSLVTSDGEHSYLTGEKMDPEQVNQRPLAVMLNNIKEGCPQTGIAEAAVIYEAPVEGRITRLMGLFEDYDAVEKIGYVRSSRDYYVYCALEFDAIYAHFGQATPYVGALLNSDAVDNISGNVAGIDRPAANTFKRSSDRPAPHNVYVDQSGLLSDIEKMGYSLTYHDTHKEKFAFAADGEKAENIGTETAVLLYPGGKETGKANGYSKIGAYFEYNEEDGKYYRYQYGDKHIDESTGEQLAYDNVIFQYCNGEVRDENDYLIFGCHGNENLKVQVFNNGKMTEGTWARYADTDPAYYMDAEGNPIEMNQGKTWICIIWNTYADDVVIE